MTTIAQINEKIDRIEGAEKITKPILSELSRDLLEYYLESEDVQPINRVLSVLTPMNKKAATIFFKHFVPAKHVTNEQGEFEKFGKKNDKAFEEKKGLISDFLDDPHNNIWTWANRNIEVEAKPFDVKKVTKLVENSIKKVGAAETIRAVFAAGLTLEEILEVMNQGQEVEVE